MQQVYDFNAISNSEIRFRFVLVWILFLALRAFMKQIALLHKWLEPYRFIELMQLFLCFVCACVNLLTKVELLLMTWANIG